MPHAGKLSLGRRFPRQDRPPDSLGQLPSDATITNNHSFVDGNTILERVSVPDGEFEL